MSNLAIARLQKEVTMLQKDPPPGAFCGPIEGKPLTELEAGIQGPTGTVYEAGVFKLSVHIPTRYPMEPPKVRFVTPVYHPNIDAEGRICLDILNPPPKGAWKPSLNISTVLSSIALLLSEPNPDDGLVTDTTYEYKHQRDIFDSKARAWTRQHAVQMKQSNSVAAPGGAHPVTMAYTAAAGHHKQKQQIEVLEDEKPVNPIPSTGGHALEEPVSSKQAVDINKENPGTVGGDGGGGGGIKRQVEEIEKPSLDKVNLHAEKDNNVITKLIDGSEPPQKKSKLSLHRD